MEKYFAELNELSGEARNALAAGKSELSNGIKPRIALAMYGDMDAVFSCFLEETSTRHLKFETKKLEKLYKKLHKRIQKMDKADNVYKAKKCFSEEELQIPYTSYKLALFCLQCNRPDWYLQHMQTAAAGGDPFAIYYCQSYYSTNSAEANPYGKNATTVKLNGAFDFDRMLYYAIRGIGITSSAYYPNVPYISFYCICNHTDVMRKDTLERLYKTLTYFVLPENIGTEEYKAHFGDFVPSPLQVKIARKWFFVDGDRLGLSSEMLTKRKLLRDQIAAAIEAEAAPQAAAKAKKETAMPKTSKTEDKKAAAPAVTIISETYASGNRYEGEALNGVRHGQGEYIFANGNRYKGAFENGKFNGYGVYTSAKGWKYEGEFRDDEFNGIGTYYWTDGDVYTGEFRNDAPNGKGKYLHADGCIYEGDFCNWKRQGKGTFTYKSGRKDISLWEDGKEALCLESHRPNSDMPQPTLAFSKNAKHIDYETGAFYDGDVVNGVPHGQGVYHEPNGDFYQGAFANGVRHGQGTSYSSTEVSDRGKKRTVLWVTHDGGWKNGKKHGHGVTVNRNRYVLRGDQWVYTELVTTEGDWVDGNVPGKYCVRTDVDSGSGLVRGTTNWYYYKDGNVEKIDNPGGGFGIDESFERKRQEAASSSPATAKASASGISTLDDDIVTEWQKIDGPGDVLEMWKDPKSFTVDTDDRMITYSCEYFDPYFYSSLDSNNITSCCEEGDCAGANEILAELLGIPESVLGSAITEYREKLYGPQAYLYGYSVGEVIHSAILAAVKYGCHPAGIMNIAMYMYLHFDNTDELFLDALKCYEHGRGIDGCNEDEGTASLWFRRYMYHNGNVGNSVFGVTEHGHCEYEDTWFYSIDTDLDNGKTMLSNGFMGNVTERPVYTDADFSTTQLIHHRLYTTGVNHVSDKRLPDGSIYSGPMTADGRPEGECTIDDPQGNHFSGYYHNGGYHGVTWIKYANGDEFAGYCCNGKKTGVGSMTWADGEKRLCIYKNDKPNGIGIYFPNYGKVRPSIYVNGEETYQKELEKKLRNAEYHTFEDSRYEGNVRYTRDGEVILEGYGTLYCNNGDVFSGLFRDDKLVEGFKYYKDELQLVYGSYDENGLPHGKATVLFAIDEKMYEGDFSHGEYEGRGKYQDYNGITYLCDWELDSAVNILEVYDLDGKLIPRSKAPFLYDLGRLEYTRY